MDESACPGCRQRDAEIAELKRRLAAVEAKLNTNSGNSSTPPSANPLGAKPPVVKKKSKRKRGAQPGHPPHLKQLLPPERMTRIEMIVPPTCQGCGAVLSSKAGPDDPEPQRFQVVELPPIVAEVTEYQAHGRTCRCCGHLTQATIPAEVRAHSVGPRLTATLSYFSGCHGVSKRGVEDIADSVFAAPIALGTVANLEQEVSAALEPSHRQALEAVRQAGVKYADETSWKLWGKLCWLWAAATVGVAVFVIHAKRSALGLKAILGENIEGIVHSDRWHVYLQVAEQRRQLCWAHLKRDLRKIVDGGGPSAFVGRRGLRIVGDLFAAWHAFQAGTITRGRLQELDCAAPTTLRQNARRRRSGRRRARSEVLREPAESGIGVVDLRTRRGCGTDQQLHGTSGASGGVVATPEFRLQQRGGLPLRGAHSHGCANLPPSRAQHPRVSCRSRSGTPLRTHIRKTTCSGMNGYSWTSSQASSFQTQMSCKNRPSLSVASPR